MKLTGADVFSLAVCALAKDCQIAPQEAQRRLHSATEDSEFRFAISFTSLCLQYADLANAQLRNAILAGACLQHANLEGAQLERANLTWADLREANLSVTHLQEATLSYAQLQGASLIGAQAQQAEVDEAHLQHANFGVANLQGTVFDKSDLQGADFRLAQLQGANFSRAQLSSVDFRSAVVDANTTFASATICDLPTRRWQLYSPRIPPTTPAFGDMRWGGVGTVDLTQIADWDAIDRLGDERGVTRRDAVNKQQAVVRAYRQLATQLRAQGMSEVADRLTHRALSYERRVFLRQGNLPRYLGSWLMAALAGYGYRPLYTVFWYLVVITLFAATYHGYGTGCAIPSLSGFLALTATGHACIAHPLTWYEAFVVSLTAFHGRGFFATTFQPGDPQAGIAAGEAVIGLLIEISFIATFTQKVFGAR